MARDDSSTLVTFFKEQPYFFGLLLFHGFLQCVRIGLDSFRSGARIQSGGAGAGCFRIDVCPSSPSLPRAESCARAGGRYFGLYFYLLLIQRYSPRTVVLWATIRKGATVLVYLVLRGHSGFHAMYALGAACMIAGMMVEKKMLRLC